MNNVANMNTVVTAQHQSHAIPPAQAKKKRTALSNKPPITTDIITAFTRSNQNVAIVVRLKPNRSSMKNVESVSYTHLRAHET